MIGVRIPTLAVLISTLVLAVASIGAGSWSSVWASDHQDHDRARAALEAGDILPLT